MADAFAMERFKARLLPPSTNPAPVYRGLSPEERVRLLMKAVTMSEIREVADRLGLSFRDAYQERARLYARRWGV
jgi:hypothetical protein